MTKMMMRPAASFTGRDGGRMMPSRTGRRGRCLRLVHAAAVHERKRIELLLDAVLVDLEIVFREVGLELPAPVADDDVRADEVDRCPEGRVRRVGRHRRGRGRRRGRLLRVRRVAKSRDHRQKARNEPGRKRLVVIVENSRSSIARGKGRGGRGNCSSPLTPRPCRVQFGRRRPLSRRPAARPPRRDRRRRRSPSAARKSRIFGSNDSMPLTDFLVGDPRVGVQRFGLGAQRLDALGVAAALGDAGQQLGVSRTQARELLASEVLLDRHRRRVRSSLQLRDASAARRPRRRQGSSSKGSSSRGSGSSGSSSEAPVPRFRFRRFRFRGSGSERF